MFVGWFWVFLKLYLKILNELSSKVLPSKKKPNCTRNGRTLMQRRSMMLRSVGRYRRRGPRGVVLSGLEGGMDSCGAQ